jgi:hypothetical protein
MTVARADGDFFILSYGHGILFVVADNFSHYVAAFSSAESFLHSSLRSRGRSRVESFHVL